MKSLCRQICKHRPCMLVHQTAPILPIKICHVKLNPQPLLLNLFSPLKLSHAFFLQPAHVTAPLPIATLLRTLIHLKTVLLKRPMLLNRSRLKYLSRLLLRLYNCPTQYILPLSILQTHQPPIPPVPPLQIPQLHLSQGNRNHRIPLIL